MRQKEAKENNYATDLPRLRTVHEPEAELLTAQDAIEDGENLRQWFRQPQSDSQPIELRMPLRILLQALDHLEPDALRQVARHAEERLIATAHAS